MKSYHSMYVHLYILDIFFDILVPSEILNKNILPVHWKMCIVYTCEILTAFRLKIS